MPYRFFIKLRLVGAASIMLISVCNTCLAQVTSNDSLLIEEIEEGVYQIVYDDFTEEFLPPVSSFERLQNQLGLYNYKPSGLSLNQKDIFINGLKWAHPESGLGSLSETTNLYLLNSTESTTTLNNDRFTSSVDFNINAIAQKQGYKAHYGYHSLNNGHYLNLNYNTGLIQHDWALSIQMKEVRAQNRMFKGTYQNTNAATINITKEFNLKHRFNILLWANNAENSSRKSITKETAEISHNSYFNPNWGYQNERMRSDNSYDNITPAALLNYTFTPSKKTIIDISGSFQQNNTNSYLIDWFHARSPYPDYYQNLPSYYEWNKEDDFNRILEELVKKWYDSGFHIDWEQLYQANRINSTKETNMPSLYVISADKKEYKTFRNAINFKHHFAAFFKVLGGVQFDYAIGKNYRKLVDLLGGKYFVNLNQFAFQSYGQENGWEQFDLNNPDKHVSKGDIYYYNYSFFIQSLESHINLQYNKFPFLINFYGSFERKYYQREGLFRNGIFKDNSFGLSKPKILLGMESDLSIRYYFDSLQYISLNSVFNVLPPGYKETFYDAKIRNDITENIEPERILGIEGGYNLLRRKFNLSLNVFSLKLNNKTIVNNFYHDDYSSFVHQILKGVDIQNNGMEVNFTYRPTKYLAVDLLAAWQQNFYTSRPILSVIKDNDTEKILHNSLVYWKNHYATSGPQRIIGTQLNFSSSKFGIFKISGTYSDQNFVNLNPGRYTKEAVALLLDNSIEKQNILHQEQLPYCFLLNFNYSYKLDIGKHFSNYSLNNIRINFGVKNILNYRNYMYSGAQQLRFDYENKNTGAFPNKYLFGTGRSYFFEIILSGK